MGNGGSSKKETISKKETQSEETIAERIDRQITEMKAVKTQEEFNEILEKHYKENKERLLLPSEEKKYATELWIYNMAIKAKRKELEEPIVDENSKDSLTKAVGKLRF